MIGCASGSLSLDVERAYRATNAQCKGTASDRYIAMIGRRVASRSCRWQRIGIRDTPDIALCKRSARLCTG
jgi:hypothetical protein